MNESRRGGLNRNGSSVSSEDCVILTTIESDDDLPNPLDAVDFLAWEEELLRFLAPLYLWRPAKVHRMRLANVHHLGSLTALHHFQACYPSRCLVRYPSSTHSLQLHSAWRRIQTRFL